MIAAAIVFVALLAYVAYTRDLSIWTGLGLIVSFFAAIGGETRKIVREYRDRDGRVVREEEERKE